jgi:oleate hydratase
VTLKIAAYSQFGRNLPRVTRSCKPEKFISDIDTTKWISFFPTITNCPAFYERIEKLSGRPIGSNGYFLSRIGLGYFLSCLSFTLFSDQPEDVQVVGLWTVCRQIGQLIKKPMCECNGDEIMTELLFHFGMLDLKVELLAHTYVSTCMMPYITSQFMPREIADRPKVVPEGCTNLGFIGNS